MATDWEKLASSIDAGSAGGARPAAVPLPATLWSMIADYRRDPEILLEAKAAPVAVQHPLARPPDDFEMIAGLDARHAVWLGELGFRWYSEIAAWTAADVATVRSVLRLTKEIGRFGWIEQAAVLAAGQQTEFARRRVLGLPATDPANDVFPPAQNGHAASFRALDADTIVKFDPVVLSEPPPTEPPRTARLDAMTVLPRSRSRVAEIDSTVDGIVTAVAAITPGRPWAAHLTERALPVAIAAPIPVVTLPLPPPPKPIIKLVPVPPLPASAEPVLPRVRLVIDGEPIARYAEDFAGPATGIEIDPDWTPASRKKLHAAPVIGATIAAMGAGEKFVPYVEKPCPASEYRATMFANTVEEATVSISAGGPLSAARAIAAAADAVSVEGLFPKSLRSAAGMTEDQVARIRRFLNALTGDQH